MKNLVAALGCASVALGACGDLQGGGSRQQIRVVGSSTVYPFTTAVAERFAQSNPDFRAPIVESTGTGAGMKLFCAGVGARYPDAENASRRIKESEFETCRKNGVKNVVELQVGIDGLAFIEGHAARPMMLELTDIYEAIAATPYGRPNTARVWKDVNPTLPAIPIQVYGPPPTSGTRDALAEMILQKACDQNPAMKALKATDEDRHREVCTKVREDNAYIEAGENDNLMVQKVSQNPGAIGIMGFSFLEQNAAKVRGMSLDGVTPSYESIASYRYPGARPLYVYVKGDHVGVIPGLKEFLAEYARGWGENGYLVQRGLIASPPAERAAALAQTTALKPLTVAELQ